MLQFNTSFKTRVLFVLLGVLPGLHGSLLSIMQLLFKLSDLPFSLSSMNISIISMVMCFLLSFSGFS